MTKNVTLLGASYPDVPSIILPQTGGGSAEFYADKPSSWMGYNAEFVQDLGTLNLTLADTSWSTWTPTNTATQIRNRSTLTTFVADRTKYEYLIKWLCHIEIEYEGGTPLSAAEQFVGINPYYITRRPSNLSRLQSRDFNAYGMTLVNSSYYVRYKNANGSLAIATDTAQGIYCSEPVATLSSSSTDTPTVTVTTPYVYAKCSDGYFKTTNAALVTGANISMNAKLYRFPIDNAYKRLQYDELVDFYLALNPPSRNIRQGEEEETEETEEPEER